MDPNGEAEYENCWTNLFLLNKAYLYVKAQIRRKQGESKSKHSVKIKKYATNKSVLGMIAFISQFQLPYDPNVKNQIHVWKMLFFFLSFFV